MVGINKFILLFCLVSFGAGAQMLHSGKIVFERRTNLLKRFNDNRMKRFVTEENKIRTEVFELLFNDTCSVFKPILSDAPDEMAWMTTRNTYFLNNRTNEKLSIFSLLGQQVFITDSLPQRAWKITDNHRNISGYDCRKAIYQKNDTTRIYAWFATELVPSAGPEGFCGLPGTILGLATEDGGVIYFAKSVQAYTPSKEELTYNLGKNKVYTLEEFRQKIDAEYGSTPWGKRMFSDLFRWL